MACILVKTEITRRGDEIFVTSIGEFLSAAGAEAPPTLSQRLATVLLSAAHGVISLPLGTPMMKWRDVRANGRPVVGNLIDAWTMKVDAARKTESWPKVSIRTFS
jgi:hypothetical protein